MSELPNPTDLTDEQLWGLACCVCGRSSADCDAMVPAGWLGRRQLFRCASPPCPTNEHPRGDTR